MRVAVRIAIYGLVIFGAYKFFNWFRQEDAPQKEQEVRVNIEERALESSSSFRKMADFSEISLNGSYEVELIQGSEYSVEIDADEGQLDQIITQVNGNRLTVTSGMGKRWNIDNGVKVKITSPNFTQISLSGGVDLETDHPIDADALHVQVSGAADMDLELHVRQLTMNLSGAANAELKGQAEAIDFQVSGAGHIEADQLQAQSAKVRLSGAGAVSVFAEKTLDVRISGAGSVTYKGDPELSKSVSGLGIIRKE